MNTRSSRFAVALQPLSLIVILALAVAASFAALTVGGLFQDRPVVLPPIATPAPTPAPTPVPTPSPATPSPAPSSPAPSSPTAITVDLIDAVGADATIDIVDLSGTLAGAVSGNPPDGASDLRVTGLEASPATIVLTWSGLPCDTTHLLTIEPDGLTMTIERPACTGDALGISHALVLTFDHPVDPAAVDVTVRTRRG